MAEKTVIESVLALGGAISAMIVAIGNSAWNWRWRNKTDDKIDSQAKDIEKLKTDNAVNNTKEEWHLTDFETLKKTVGDMPKNYAKVQDVTSLAAKLDKHDADNKKQIEEHDKNVKRIEAKYDEQLVNLQKSTLDAINNLGELIRKSLEKHSD